MQDIQHVLLDSRENTVRSTDLARMAKEDTLRRRRNHAEGGGAVRFSSVFAIVDNSLEMGAESLKRGPKREASKEVENEKDAELPVAVANDPKSMVAEAPKDAPKAKPETESKGKTAKETVSRKAENLEAVSVQAVFVQARVEAQVQRAAQTVQRTDVKVERRDVRAAERSKSQERVEAGADLKGPVAAARDAQAAAAQTDKVLGADAEKGQDRRARTKARDAADSKSEVREEKRSVEAPKAPKAEDDVRSPVHSRERVNERATTERPEPRQTLSAERKADEGEISERGKTNDAGQSESTAKKRTVSDLEKLTGLQARTVLEAAAVILPPQDITIKAAVDVAVKGIAVDAAAKPAVKVAGASTAQHQQHAGGSDGQSQTAKSHDRLGETARRLTSYLSGKAETTLQAEQTFSDMVAKARMFMENGRSEMTIQLKPDQLGSLSVKMVVEDGKMEARFVTDRPEVKALIEQNADLLKSKLAEVGIEVSSLNVDVRSDAGQTGTQDEQSGGLRRVTYFGGGDETEPGEQFHDAHIAYARAGMGLNLSMVA